MPNKKYFNIIIGLLVIFLLGFIFISNFPLDVSGDDSKIYTHDPYTWLNQVSPKLWFGYFGGFNPQAYSFATVTLFYLISLLGIGQGLIYYLLLIGSIYLCYSVNTYLAKLLFNSNYKFLSLVSGCIYVTAPILLGYVFYNAFSNLFNIVLVPLSFLIFFKLESLTLPKIIVSAVSLSFLSLVLSFPIYSIPILISLILLLILFSIAKFYTKNQVIRIVRNGILLAFVYLIFNIYWIGNLAISLIASNPMKNFTEQNNPTIVALNTLEFVKGIINPIEHVQLLPSKLLIGTSSYLYSLLEFQYRYSLLYFIFPLIVSFGLFYLLRNNKINKIHKFYIPLLLVGFSFFFFTTANITSVGVFVYELLFKFVPGWVIFRNFFNKFPIVYTYLYSLIIFISLVLISKRNKLIFYIFNFLLMIIIIMNAKILFVGNIFLLQILSPNDGSFRVNYPIKSSYLNTVAKLDNSRILSFPLSTASWNIVPSDYRNLYVGISPWITYANNDDINGRFAFEFIDIYVPGFSLSMLNSLKSNDVSTFKKLVDFMSIEHIFLSREALYNTSDFVKENMLWEPKLQTAHSEWLLNSSYEKNENLSSKDYTFYKVDNKDSFIADKVVVYNEGMSLLELFDTKFYSKKAVYIKDIEAPSIDYSTAYKVYKLSSFSGTSNHPGYKDLKINVNTKNPESLSYKLSLIKEKLSMLLKEDVEKPSELKWLMLKRVKEHSIYDESYLIDALETLLKNYNDYLLTIESKANQELEINEFYTYILYLKSIDAKIFENINIKDALRGIFSLHNPQECNFDLCFDDYSNENYRNIYIRSFLTSPEPIIMHFQDSSTQNLLLNPGISYKDINYRKLKGLNYSNKQSINLNIDETDNLETSFYTTKPLQRVYEKVGYVYDIKLSKSKLSKDYKYKVKGNINIYSGCYSIYIFGYSSESTDILASFNITKEVKNYNSFFKPTKDYDYVLTALTSTCKDSSLSVLDLKLEGIPDLDFYVYEEPTVALNAVDTTLTSNFGRKYQLLNPTNKNYFYVLNQRYDPFWNSNDDNATHFKANGLMNGWYINNNENQSIDFTPYTWIDKFNLISLTGIVLSGGLVCFYIFKRKY